MVDEDADVMKESIDGFEEFAKVARTPELRREALGQAAMSPRSRPSAKQLFALATPGKPLPAARRADRSSRSRRDIEAADESNDKLVEAEEARHDRDRRRRARRARSPRERLIAILLGARRAARRRHEPR